MGGFQSLSEVDFYLFWGHLSAVAITGELDGRTIIRNPVDLHGKQVKWLYVSLCDCSVCWCCRCRHHNCASSVFGGGAERSGCIMCDCSVCWCCRHHNYASSVFGGGPCFQSPVSLTSFSSPGMCLIAFVTVLSVSVVLRWGCLLFPQKPQLCDRCKTQCLYLSSCICLLLLRLWQKY